MSCFYYPTRVPENTTLLLALTVFTFLYLITGELMPKCLTLATRQYQRTTSKKTGHKNRLEESGQGSG